jgi:2-furoyl-CoA dehydrogenase 2Fe-2S iron sulfur subunit
MSLQHFLEEKPDAEESDIRAMLSGHLCRCTGYTGIVRAALEMTRRKAPPLETH